MNKEGDIVNIYHTENEALEKVSTPTIKDQNTKK